MSMISDYFTNIKPRIDSRKEFRDLNNLTYLHTELT